MNPSGTNSPSYDQASAGLSNTSNAVANLTQSVGALAPLAATYHGPAAPVAYAPYAKAAGPSSPIDILPAFWNKATAVAGQTAGIAGTLGQWIGTQLVNAATAPFDFRDNIQKGWEDRVVIDSLTKQSQNLNQVQDSIMQAYKSGRMTKEAYIRELNSLASSYQDLARQSAEYESKTSLDQQNATKAAIGTATDVVALMTGGLGAGLSSPELIAGNTEAAGLLASASELTKGAEVISTLASSEAEWTALSPLAQQAMRTAATQVLTAAGKSATAAQVTRAIAADLLLKLPLYYNAFSGTGLQLYDELNQNKYGDAVKTLAFNGALLLSGGPIGWGVRQGGKLAKGTSVALGLRPGSILDELSSRIGDGNRLGLAKIAQEQLKAGNAADVRAMIVALESNLKAAGGNAALAINKITDHLENYISWGSMKNMTHQKAWDNIVNYWKHAEGLQTLKSEGKIAGVAANDERIIVPGRFSTQDKNGIAAAVTKSDLALSGGADTGTVPAAPEATDMSQAPGFLQSEGTTATTATPTALTEEQKGLIQDYPRQLEASDKTILQSSGMSQKRIRILQSKIESAYRAQDAIESAAKAEPTVLTEAGQTATTRPNGDIQSQIEQLMNTPLEKRSPPYDFATQAVRLAQKLPPQDAASELRNLTIDGKNIGNEFYKSAVDPQTNKISLVLKDAAVDPLKMTPDEVAAKVGFTPPTAAEQLSPVEQRLKAWADYKAANPNAAFANNPNVDKQITTLIQTTSDPEALHRAINNIPTQLGLDGIPADYAAKMAKDGYIAIVPQSHNLPVVPFAETSGTLATRATGAANGASGASGNFFVRAGAPVPVLRSLGAFLTHAGLSPEMASQRVQDVFTQKFSAASQAFGFLSLHGDTAEQTAQDTLAKLYDYMKAPTGGFKVFGHYLPITDMRQLTAGDITRALGVSREDAKTVQSAIMQAYLDVPTAVTGLGPKIVDLNFAVNPLAAPYSRLQGALRFSWNPVFTQAKLPIKAEFLAQMETGGKFPTIAGTNRFMQVFFPGKYRELNAIIDNPDFKALLPGGVGGEAEGAATGASAVASSERTPRNALLPVAGLIQSMADRVGLSPADFIKQFPTEVQDTTTALLHYDRNNSFLNSPLTKTLNIAFFPFRFNVKVTTFMARFLAKQPPAIQYAAVKGLLGADAYLKSPQGQAWYAQNSDAISLFKYFSPLETLSVISSALGLQHDSVAQYGELGGLPFGWIPMALDAAGLTHFGQAYVNPKTGVIAKDYVPTSAYGAANAAIQDLLGSLFTYPGATAGLPSKGSIDRAIVGQLLPGSSKDFKAVTPPNITPQDQQFSQIAQQVNGQASSTTPAATPSGAAPQTSPSLRVPPQATPLTLPTARRSGAPRKKKADFTPSLLPGQTTLGQL